MRYVAEKQKLRILVLIVAIGILLDGLTTIVGDALGLTEINPIAKIIGVLNLFALSLFIRSAIVVVFMIYIARIKNSKQVIFMAQMSYIMVFFTWLFVLWNIGQIIIVLSYDIWA